MKLKPTPQGSAASSRSSSQRPTCTTHGLATGPDGYCTLCKREALGSYRRPEAEPPSEASRVMTALIGVAALASVGVALAFSLGWIDLGSSTSAVAPRAEASAPSSAPKPRGFAPEQPRLAHQGAERTGALPAAAEPSPASDARAIVEQEQRLKAQLEQDRQRREASDAEQLERDRQRREAIHADIEARARKRARERVSVIMYSTKWCGVCTKAREHMVDNGIAFVEHDVEDSESARETYRRLNPKGGVPTIDVEGELLIGFSGVGLEKLIDKAVDKRAR